MRLIEFRSICRNCKEKPYWNMGAYTNHVWWGECFKQFNTENRLNYVPSDNLEYLEWCLEKKNEHSL